ECGHCATIASIVWLSVFYTRLPLKNTAQTQGNSTQNIEPVRFIRYKGRSPGVRWTTTEWKLCHHLSVRLAGGPESDIPSTVPAAARADSASTMPRFLMFA